MTLGYGDSIGKHYLCENQRKRQAQKYQTKWNFYDNVHTIVENSYEDWQRWIGLSL